ncbi:DUF7452 domain-containing protein [Aquimarina spongiae]|uniref:DUF7452 domain-containing protein n=1 Tax=Aquimarina spongiae TaxID=570521 RepID=A0A1M6IX52_9FLAO|nr:hypothetical protein [Aquimarina spongiae]SHJ39055.1 hypothetical protein SAMN04488508_108119 [Aquimarina spongiae]
MKTITKHIKISLVFTLFLCIGLVFPQRTVRAVAAKPLTIQKAFKHVASTANTSGHITTLGNIPTTNVENKLLFVTHDYGSRGPYVTQSLGVWLNGKKWTIFSQNKSAIKPGSKFNVLVTNKSSNAFVHKTTAANKAGAATKINHRALNNNPNATFLITQNYGRGGPYNPHHVGVRYSGGFWYIFNLDGQSMPSGAQFNVLINSGIFKHQVTSNNRRNHTTGINSPRTNGKKQALVFVTFNSQGSIKNFNNAIGVYLVSDKWYIYNENKKYLQGNEAYNVLSYSASQNTKPRITVVAKKPTTSVTGRVVVKPRTDTRQSTNTVRVTPRTSTSNGSVRVASGTTNTGRRVRVAQNKPATQTNVLRNIGIVRTIPFIKPANPGSTDRLGPETKSVPLDFSRSIDGEQYQLFTDTFNFFEDIYKDQNPRSNVLYYFPANYSINWDKQSNKYDFNVYYMSAEDRKKGNVLLNVELTSNITTDDIDLAENYLSSRLGKRITLKSIDLRENPSVDFGATLTNFNVKPESVSTSVPSDYQKPIILDWKMESNVDNFVGAMLNNRSGNVMLNFKPYGDSLKVVQVPINLKVNSPITYGKIKFNSLQELKEGWTNYLDYPIIPKKFIVLKKRGRSQYFETIEIPRQEVASGSKYIENDPTILNKISEQNSIIKIWLDYVLNDECRTCNQQVKRKIIGGTSGSEIANIEVQILNAIAYSGANSLKLNLKSLQGDPNGINEIEFPSLSVNEDGQSFNEIQLFVPQGKEMSYEYQVILIMDNGDVMTSRWEKGNTNLLVLGESQIKRLFPDKKKDDLLDRAKDGVLKKVKDSILGGDVSDEEILDKGIKIIGGLFKKKKPEEENEEPEEEENVEQEQF